MPGEPRAATVNYVKLIENAITALKDIDKEMAPNKRYTGLSLAALSKYLIQNNEFEDDVKAKGKIKVATKKMLDSEKLIKTSGTGLTGKFKLAEPPKAPAKPKVKKEKPGPATSAEKKAKAAAKKKAPAKKKEPKLDKDKLEKEPKLDKDKLEKIYEDLENGLDGNDSGSDASPVKAPVKPKKVAKKTKPPVPTKESESESERSEDDEPLPLSPPKKQKKGKVAAVESEESEEDAAPASPAKASPVKKGKKVAKKTKPPVPPQDEEIEKKVTKKTKKPVPEDSDEESDKENSPVKAKPKGRVAKPKVNSKVVKKVPAKKTSTQAAKPIADLVTPPPKTALKGRPQPNLDYDLSTGTEESGTGEEFLSEEE